MKRKKTISIIVAVLAICVAAVLLFGNPKKCCLCNNPSYAAPCLIDLETGDIMELRLDGPTTSGPEEQADVSTFSFIRFGNITGTKQTAPNVITLKIPAEEKIGTPVLCRKCHKLLPKGYEDRYVLADIENRRLYPITAGSEITVCGFQIRIVQEPKQVSIRIVGP